MPTDDDFEADVRNVLVALARRKNVLISGPPGTGKSRLLALVQDAFTLWTPSLGAQPFEEVQIPADDGPLPPWFPSPDCLDSRQVFPTAFDQSTKTRDFLRGLVPAVGQAGVFEVSSGTLYRAAVHASADGHASLVVIDEINRGPAVAAFGSSIVGLEADKRLGPDGHPIPTTQFFELMDDAGEAAPFALPPDLYILAAMNEADTSVEPLDVAFLRRFAPYRLEPETSVLFEAFGLADSDLGEKPPAEYASVSDVYRALILAWKHLNDRVSFARGPAYQLGHGALLHRKPPMDTPAAAAEFAREGFATMKAHLDEVFFGDSRAVAELLGAGLAGSPYVLQEELFAGQSLSRIIGPTNPTAPQAYAALVAIAGA